MYRSLSVDNRFFVKCVAVGECFNICETPKGEKMKALMVEKDIDIPEFLKSSVVCVESVREVASALALGIRMNLRVTPDGNVERQVKGGWKKVNLPQVLTLAGWDGNVMVASDVPMLVEWKESDEMSSGYETWPVADWRDRTYRDPSDAWHNKPSVLDAALMVRECIPPFAEGGKVTWSESGLEVKDSCGRWAKGKYGESYIVRYPDDNPDGSPNLDVLERPNMGNYSVCTPDGIPLCRMKELDDAVQKVLAEDTPDSVKNYWREGVPFVESVKVKWASV